MDIFTIIFWVITIALTIIFLVKNKKKNLCRYEEIKRHDG
jgi:hypothetical protein